MEHGCGSFRVKGPADAARREPDLPAGPQPTHPSPGPRPPRGSGPGQPRRCSIAVVLTTAMFHPRGCAGPAGRTGPAPGAPQAPREPPAPRPDRSPQKSRTLGASMSLGQHRCSIDVAGSDPAWLLIWTAGRMGSVWRRVGRAPGGRPRGGSGNLLFPRNTAGAGRFRGNDRPSAMRSPSSPATHAQASQAAHTSRACAVLGRLDVAASRRTGGMAVPRGPVAPGGWVRVSWLLRRRRLGGGWCPRRGRGASGAAGPGPGRPCPGRRRTA